jgi:periplasmic protein TonB
MRRLVGLAVSVLVHLGVIAAIVALVRVAAPPVLFVDLAHGLDVAEQAVSDLRRAVADARSRVLPRAGAPRAKSDGAPQPAASAPVSSPPSAPPAETRRVETPAPPAVPEPVRPAPEPSPPVASAPPPPPAQPAPEPRTVDLSAATAVAADGAASPSTTERAAAPATGGRDSGGRGAGGTGAPGATAGVGDGQSGAGARSGARDGNAVALAIPGTGGGDPAAADYAGYYATLRQRLYESLTYPQSARRRGLTGTVLVDVEIDASGKLGRVTVVTSSKHSVLDEAALDALHGVKKIPFPPGVPPRRLLVRLPVVFDLR